MAESPSYGGSYSYSYANSRRDRRLTFDSDSGSPLYIGADVQGSKTLDGAVDEVYVYEDALDAWQVGVLYGSSAQRRRRCQARRRRRCRRSRRRSRLRRRRTSTSTT